jgi:7,8-dihydropterin-6-yl-methyl-4-(beta-D-ribofuranosyl)aminobenzene 5'-phosphate synthase
LSTDAERVDPAMLKAVDSAEICVLVDNVSDLLSTVPPSITSEIPNLLKAGAREMSGECLCCAHWGLSLVVTLRLGDRRRTVLFDSGPEGYAIDRNGDRLGIDFGAIEAIVLSHGHWDHAGGMLSALARIRAQNGGRPVPFHVNPGMFVRRALRFPDGRTVPFKDIPGEEELARHGAEVVNASDARLLLDGTFYLSGEIPRVTPYEKGLPGHLKWSASGDGWEPDSWIMDERFLAVNVRGKGILVFTACSHAGVVNVLKHAREQFAPTPLYGVMGGFHLSGAACEKIIPETVEDMRSFGLKTIVAGHCTGWRAVHALVNAFGEEVVVPSAVGRLHTS